MTGRSAPRSSWILDLAIPAMLVVAEAAWVVLLVRARVVGDHHVAIDLPFLAVALPALVATLVFEWLRRLRLGRRAKRVLLWVAAVVGVALSAGLISELSVAGSLLVVATHPWAGVGHRAATVAGTAWLVAAIAWARASWLGSAPVSFRHAAWSVALAGAAFLGIFIGHAAGRHGWFAATTSDAGWLFFVSFALGAATVALVRQRDLEEQVLPKATSRPGAVWLSVLAVPMAIVAAIGLGLAFAGGPTAPVVGRAIARGAKVVGRLVADLLSLLPAVHIKVHATKLPALKSPPLGRSALPKASGHASALVVYLGFAALGVLAIGLLVLAYILVKRFWPKRRPAEPTDPGDEEEDSIFTWAHLWAQLLAALGRLVPRRRRPGPVSVARSVAGTFGADPDPPPRPNSVREAYRGMLIEARVLGSPRGRSETTIELEARLLASIEGPAAVSVRRLTGVYDDVRYGDVDAGEVGDLGACADAEVVVPALRLALTPPQPPEPDNWKPAPPVRARRPVSEFRRRGWRRWRRR